MKLLFQMAKLVLFFLVFSGVLSVNVYAQNDAMLQGFYWDVPVDDVNNDGSWWDTLAEQADLFKAKGFTAIWVPMPCKGNAGIWDMGYGVFDHYDLGNYFQKGTRETRMGSREELENMINVMHASPKIEVISDVVLNHIYAYSDDHFEPNPAVKHYVFSEAKVNGNDFVPFPSNEIIWRIPQADPGTYYIKIKGYKLADDKKGYNFQANWTGGQWNNGWTDMTGWESEPNNGGGASNDFTTSGMTMRGRIDPIGSDIDEYKITIPAKADLVMKLTVMGEKQNPWEWFPTDQQRGLYPAEIWFNGQNLASTKLEACTMTNIQYVEHTGLGEANYSWNYEDFHPVDVNDFLTSGDSFEDALITNTKMFGNDFNTYSSRVQTRLNDWGKWMVDVVGFDGFRLDFVRGFQVPYVASWIKNLPKVNDNQRFIVAEYWTGHHYRLKDWINDNAKEGATVTVFDFPLKNDLTRMCNNGQYGYNMSWLNNAGMVRDAENSVSGLNVVTFLDNHDTGREPDKWVTKDMVMGYAYMLTHEGRPCVFYPHYFSVPQVHWNDTVKAPVSLKDDLDKLMFARRTYLGGVIKVLSQSGNPYPADDTKHVYIARREGNGVKSGAIVVINNHENDTKGLWVNNTVEGMQDWKNKTLVNAFNPSEKTQVFGDGRVYLSAPKRGYSLWVLESEYVAMTDDDRRVSTDDYQVEMPSEFKVAQNYPNPFNPSTIIGFELPTEGNVSVKVFNALGQLVDVIKDGHMAAGKQAVTWNANSCSNGVYFYEVSYKGNRVVNRMVLMK